MIQRHSCAPSICSLMDALQTVPLTKRALFLGNNVFAGMPVLLLSSPFRILSLSLLLLFPYNRLKYLVDRGIVLDRREQKRSEQGFVSWSNRCSVIRRMYADGARVLSGVVRCGNGVCVSPRDRSNRD